MVDDLVVAAEVGVLVGERVEAVRAARDDLRHAGLVHRRHVLLREGLERVLVAHPPSGVARARLARAEDGEVDAGGLQQLRGRLRGRLRALVVGGGAADPVEHLGGRLPRLQHAHVEPLRPVGALGLRLAPGVLRALDVAQHRLAVRREAALDHDEVAAQVDDVVDVLDRHRALLHAGAAGDAIPDDVVADGVRDERGRLERLSPLRRGEEVRPLGEQLVAQAHDQELRRELLARRVRRADVLAAAALGARHRVDHLLPRHVGDRGRAEAHLGLVLDREVERLEAAAAARAAEPDVDRRRRDVEVLGVRQVGEEADDEQDVRPDEDPLAHLGPRALAEHLRDRVRDRRGRRGPLVQPGRDQRRVPEQQREHDHRDQPEDQVGLAEVAALEPLGALHLADPERRDHADEDEHDEEVDEEREPALMPEPGKRRAFRDGADQRHHDRREEDQEAPEDEGVDEARAEPLEELLLAEHDNGLVAHALRHVVGA